MSYHTQSPKLLSGFHSSNSTANIMHVTCGMWHVAPVWVQEWGATANRHRFLLRMIAMFWN
jgi:hypothetical protein